MHIKQLILSRGQKCSVPHMQVQQKHWIQRLFLSMVPAWKDICTCALFISTNASLCQFHTYVVTVSFINTTKSSKATNIVVCFLCAKAQKEQKMNSAES